MQQQNSLTAHFNNARPTALAALLRYFRDLEIAEDALQEAYSRAIQAWQDQGIPADPSAWLIRVARNIGVDHIRKQSRIRYTADIQQAIDTQLSDESYQDAADTLDKAHYKDDVLRLMFMCCHTELNTQDQLALALKILAGLSSKEIARAFIVAPKTMEQRITRAKKKAAATAQQLDTPSPFERLQRLEAVGLMVYLLFNEGYSASGGTDHIRLTLCEEAIRLARLLVSLFPSQAETKGLLSLCLLQHSRAKARLNNNDELVTLEEQDRRLWNRALIQEGQALLEQALRNGQPGPLQIQAAIAATHCRARIAAETDWQEIERLYTLLYQLQPTAVVALNHAAAIAKSISVSAALAQLAPLASELAAYLPYQATLADLLAQNGQTTDAIRALKIALTLESTPQESAYLQKKLRQLENK